MSAAGCLFVVSAPSGAGKTTLVGRLMANDPAVRQSVSYTTRAPRPGEQDGVHYHFVDKAGFELMRTQGEFLEWAQVHGNYYGTSRSWLQDQLVSGQDVLLEIDWQGAAQVRKLFPAMVSIFVLPPSMDELARRLRGRGSDSDSVIAERLEGALDEMRHVDEFDFVIINKDLDVALGELIAAVKLSRLRFPQQRARHPDVFDFLVSPK